VSESGRHRQTERRDGARTILHVDLDAFFAAVEMRDDAALRGKPVVVGADPQRGRGRGVVAAASYEARRFGIHSAMPISQAYRRCPSAVFVRPRGAEYAATSERFMAILLRFSDAVEPVSIDEAFVDVTASARLFGDGVAIAEQIKEAVRREERLTASIGVAPVKFVAKIASALRKPDGLVVVAPEQVEGFLDGVGIERLWGAGPRAVRRFRELGVETIGDVARRPLPVLEAAFGKRSAAHFAALARGLDERRVNPRHERKSVGKETTFLDDEKDRAIVEATLLDLVEGVTRRLRRKRLAGSTVTVKLRTADFHTVTRRAILPAASDTVEEIWPRTRELLHKADGTRLAIRLVGVAVSGLRASDRRRDRQGQLSLFAPAGEPKSQKIAQALDAVTERFGDAAIQRGRATRSRRRPVHGGGD
jgi:DNA polymerase IV